MCDLHFVGWRYFYFIEKRELFVRHWAVEAIFFGAAWFLAQIVVRILGGIFFHTPGIGSIFALLFGVLNFIVWLSGVILRIIGIIKAFQGQKWEYPFVSAQGRKLFPKIVA